MDPYEFTQTVSEEPHQEDQSDLKKLEQDLAPTAADYYGVLNVSRKVITIKTHKTRYQAYFFLYRLQKTKLKKLIKNYVDSFILTR